MAPMASSNSEVKTYSKTCPKNNETLKKQYDNLRTELNKSQSDLANYKRALASVKEQLAFYKQNVKTKKRQNENNLLKINNYDNATKSLDKVIGSQLINNNKKGLGYNVVHPPLMGQFVPPSIDLSHSGIEKFKEPEFEGYGLRANKSVCENSSNETKKNSDAPLIEEWVSDNEDEVESPVVVEKKTVVPTIPKVDVVRPKQQEKPVRKPVKYAEMYRSQGPRGNKKTRIIKSPNN
ncbi:hypothetical protein Tco_0355578 [Tanacetum coccineum]